MAPAYANLFMSKLRNHLISLASNHVWTGNTTEFEQYCNMETINPTIKFMHEISDTELTFLNVTLYKGDRFLETNILNLKTHIKDTDNSDVHSKSYHPPSTIKAGEAKRYQGHNQDFRKGRGGRCKMSQSFHGKSHPLIKSHRLG